MFLHSIVYYPSWGLDIFQPQLFVLPDQALSFYQVKFLYEILYNDLEYFALRTRKIFEILVLDLMWGFDWAKSPYYMVVRGCVAHHHQTLFIDIYFFNVIGVKVGLKFLGWKYPGWKFPRSHSLLHNSMWMCRPSLSHAIDW